MNLQTSTKSQMALAKYLEQYPLDDHIKKLITVYKKRRDLMIKTMVSHFPKSAKYQVPEGGLFLWVTLEGDVDTKEIMKIAVKNLVAFVPGQSFFPNSDTTNTMRLNFSNMTEEKIVEGIKRLGAILKEV